MAPLPASGDCQCRSDATDDACSVATESTSGRRLVLRALTYLHVQDQDTGVTRLVAGPCSYNLKENQRVTLEPQPMVVVPSAHYCTVDSPALRTDGLVAFDEVGQARLRHGEREVRLHQQPFPLYPGETLAGDVRPLPVVCEGQALRLRALQDVTDYGGTRRRAGDEWLFGPGTYMPCPEVTVVTQVDAITVGANQALRLRALRDTEDSEGTQRKAGDEWMVMKKGAYIPAVGVELVETLELERVTLTDRQYCVLYGDDKPQHKVLKGPKSFFLQPGETLRDGIQDIFFLEANEGLDLVARKAFTDETVTPAVFHGLGDHWTVRGPFAEFIPPVDAKVLKRHSAIPLGPNQGVYVQNTVTGEVRMEMGKPYLLTVQERLWSKELQSDAEQLLATYRRDTGAGAPERDKTRMVTYCVPEHRYSLVENHGTGENRTVLGPKLVTLLPDEQFRVFSMPGGTPVNPDHSKSLTLPWSSDGAEHLCDHIYVFNEPDIYVRVAWHMLCGETGKVPKVAKNAADTAFLDLKNRLRSDAKGHKLQNRYERGHFAFVYAYNPYP